MNFDPEIRLRSSEGCVGDLLVGLHVSGDHTEATVFGVGIASIQEKNPMVVVDQKDEDVGDQCETMGSSGIRVEGRHMRTGG